MAADIFISYRRADKAWSQLLHSRLKSEGVEAWYDAHVEAGQDWRLATARALEESKIFVLLFSENAAHSSDIAKELAAAVLKKKLIIPVRLENIEPSGPFLYELASRNWIDAYDDTEAKLGELAKGLARLVRTGTRDESLLPFEHTERSAKTSRRKRPFVAAAAVTLILASAITAWLLRPAAHWTVESSRSFISTVALEGEPSFSPDGKTVAYTSGPEGGQRKIYVRNLAGGDGIKITGDAYDDSSPTWSPDGTRIAYVAQKPGELCRIMLAAVSGGEARQVARCNRARTTLVSWQPGTSFLYYFDRVGPFDVFIFRLDLDSGALLQLPKASPDHVVAIQQLQCSPDGKSLLYVRGRSASTEAIVIRDLASGKEMTLAILVGGGLATWSEDSRSVLASTASGIGSRITAYPVNGEAPYRVYTTTINVSHLAAGAGGLLALETDTSRQNLARVRPDPGTQPDIVDPVNGKTWAPTFAPDGTLAFLSNRSGNNAVWMMKPGAAPAVLFDAGLAPLFRLQYAPDGTRLVLVTAGENMNIKILTADGGTVASFDAPSIGFANPTWTPDGKAVILFDIPTAKLVRVTIDSPSQRTPVADIPWEMLASYGNSLYSVRVDQGGIWQYGSAPRLISSKYPRDFAPPITFRGDDVLIPDFNAAGGARILSQPLTGGSDRLLGYAPGAEAQDKFFESKMAVNPKTGEVIYVAAVQGDTNIDLLTLGRY
jgi:Tol biopolymer transport system component